VDAIPDLDITDMDAARKLCPARRHPIVLVQYRLPIGSCREFDGACHKAVWSRRNERSIRSVNDAACRSNRSRRSPAQARGGTAISGRLHGSFCECQDRLE
jgi:hypothetical protein